MIEMVVRDEHRINLRLFIICQSGGQSPGIKGYLVIYQKTDQSSSVGFGMV